MTQCHDIYESDPLATASFPLVVRDVMTSPAITVKRTATVKEVAHVLLSHDIRAVPVVDVGDVLAGMISESDIICRECPTAHRHTLGGRIDRVLGHGPHWAAKADGNTAEEIMTTAVASCGPSEPISGAARLMLADGPRLLPVVEDRCVVGVLSRHDVLRVFDRPDAEIAGHVDRLLASRVWAPEGHNAKAEVTDGVVTLGGTVRYPSDAWIIVSSIAEIPGVISVHHHLAAELPEPKPSILRSGD